MRKGVSRSCLAVLVSLSSPSFIAYGTMKEKTEPKKEESKDSKSSYAVPLSILAGVLGLSWYFYPQDAVVLDDGRTQRFDGVKPEPPKALKEKQKKGKGKDKSGDSDTSIVSSISKLTPKNLGLGTSVVDEIVINALVSEGSTDARDERSYPWTTSLLDISSPEDKEEVSGPAELKIEEKVEESKPDEQKVEGSEEPLTNAEELLEGLQVRIHDIFSILNSSITTGYGFERPGRKKPDYATLSAAIAHRNPSASFDSIYAQFQSVVNLDIQIVPSDAMIDSAFLALANAIAKFECKSQKDFDELLKILTLVETEIASFRVVEEEVNVADFLTEEDGGFEEGV